MLHTCFVDCVEVIFFFKIIKERYTTYNRRKNTLLSRQVDEKIVFFSLVPSRTARMHPTKKLIIMRKSKKRRAIGYNFGIQSIPTLCLYNCYHTVSAGIFTLKRNPFRKTRWRCGKTHFPDDRKNVDSYSTSGYTVLVRSRVGGSSLRCRGRYMCVYIYGLNYTCFLFYTISTF